MIKIGVFDSGIGGLSVKEAIEKALPQAEVIFISDKLHVPYGDKPMDEVFGYVLPIVLELEAQKCDVVVIACNTVTTNLIGRLRSATNVPLIGIEPMIKPAAATTKTGVVAVCATPATLTSERYRWLKFTHAQGIKVLEPDCRQWAYMIEHSQLNAAELHRQINEVCEQGADVIVLGCTHYHWIQDEIQQIAKDRAVVIQPEQAIVARLKHVLTDRGLLP
jgi:glutamate racemase